jgi:hypothetical protein
MNRSSLWLAFLFAASLTVISASQAAAQNSRPVPTPLVIDEWERRENNDGGSPIPQETDERQHFDWDLLNTSTFDSENQPHMGALTSEEGAVPGLQQIPWETHERQRFDWDPGFALNIPTFDSENRPYVRVLTGQEDGLPDLQVLGADAHWDDRGLEYGGTDLLHALLSEETGSCGYKLKNPAGDTSTKIVFDREDDAYFVTEIELKRRINNRCRSVSEKKLILFHSRDRASTWTPYLLPRHGKVAYEHPWSPENLEGPPAIIVFQEQGNIGIYAPDDKSLGNHGDLWLFAPDKRDDGELVIGDPVLVSDRASGFASHSGAPSVVATWNNRTYVVWGETPEYDPIFAPLSPYGDPPWIFSHDRPSGVPTYINVLDREHGTLSGKRLLAFASPVDDSHNVPGLVIDSRGGLHVVTGSHGGHFQYLRSRMPERIDDWTAPRPTTTASTGRDCQYNTQGWQGGCQTYLAFMRDSKDTLHLSYRQWYAEPGRHDGDYYAALVHQRMQIYGEWESPQQLVVPAIPGYYIYYHKMSIDKDDRLYLLYHHFSNKHDPYCGKVVDENDPEEFSCTRSPRGLGAMLVTDDTRSWRLVGTNEMAAGIGWEPLSTHLGDTDGDGLAEVVSTTRRPQLKILTERLAEAEGASVGISTTFHAPAANTYPTLMGDVDGDGLEDLVFLSRSVDGWLTVETRRSQGDGSWTDLGSDVLDDGPGVQQYPTLMGDVTGDGRDDLVFVFRHWKDGWLTIRTKASNGDGTWTDLPQQKLGDGPGVHQYPTLMGDVTGDGLDDLVFVFRHWKNGMLSTRTKAAAGGGVWHNWGQDQMTDGPGVHQYPTLLGDVTGDGHADLVFVFRDWQTGELAIRTKEAMVDASRASLDWRDLGHFTLPDGPGVHQYPTQLGDVTGDGLDDLVFVFEHWADGERSIRVKRSLGDGEFVEQ